MIMDRLYNEALKSPVCVGLDTRIDFLPQYLKDKDWSGEKRLGELEKKNIVTTKALFSFPPILRPVTKCRSPATRPWAWTV